VLLLSHDYFTSLRKHAVPLDEQARGGLAHFAVRIEHVLHSSLVEPRSWQPSCCLGGAAAGAASVRTETGEEDRPRDGCRDRRALHEDRIQKVHTGVEREDGTKFLRLIEY